MYNFWLLYLYLFDMTICKSNVNPPPLFDCLKNKKAISPILTPNRASNWKKRIVLIKLKTYNFQFNLQSETTDSRTLLLSFWQTTKSHPQTAITRWSCEQLAQTTDEPQTTDHHHHAIEVSVAITTITWQPALTKLTWTTISTPHPLTKHHTTALLGQVSIAITDNSTPEVMKWLF